MPEGNRCIFFLGLLETDRAFKGMFLKLWVAKGKVKPKKIKASSHQDRGLGE